MVIEKYLSEIKETIELIHQVEDLNISSINIYGSGAHDEIFNEGYSDIDMIIMCNNFNHVDLNKVVDKLCSYKYDFKDKKPLIMDDYLCKRIEFYLKFPTISVDVTISPGLIPSNASLEKNVCYDNFESLMGGIYVYSKQLYGEIPDYDRFKSDFFPFYSDELRNERLDILSKRIKHNNSMILKYLNDGNIDLTDIIYKTRKYFVQFLYIYNRKYYLSPEKHTHYQLTNILELPEDEKNIICLIDANIFSAAEKYIELSNRYLESYEKEKKVLKKEMK